MTEAAVPACRSCHPGTPGLSQPGIHFRLAGKALGPPCIQRTHLEDFTTICVRVV